MYKVLVFGMTSNYGGVESVIINYYKNFDRSKIHFDFICNTPDKIAYEDELESMGSKIYHLPKKRKNPIRYFSKLNYFFDNYAQDFDCLWFNVNNLVNIDCLRLAKKYGIKRRIVHSHNSRMLDDGAEGYIKKYIHKYHKRKIGLYATDLWACSNDAAKWMFPQALFYRLKIIKNAINVDLYKFQENKREYLRKKYRLHNSFVIGNVGRLSYQKNQIFLLKVFKKFQEKNKNSKLVLMGDGEKKNELKLEARKLNIEDDVLFLGMVKDTASWYSAFDVFAFPSLFEGLGIAGIEAQANGLPVIATKDKIPYEIKINNNFEFIELDNSTNEWVEGLTKFKRITNQKQISNNFKEKGFDIFSAKDYLEKMFLNNESKY